MISSVLAGNHQVLLTAFSFDQVLQSRGSTYGACYLGGSILSLAEHEAVQTCLIGYSSWPLNILVLPSSIIWTHMDANVNMLNPKIGCALSPFPCLVSLDCLRW